MIKKLINKSLFISKQPQTDYQKPLYVKSGSETPDQIGPPPIPEYDLGDLREKYDECFMTKDRRFYEIILVHQ